MKDVPAHSKGFGTRSLRSNSNHSDSMILFDLDMLIACIHLVVKMPENYRSSLLQGFFRNNVCLFLRPLVPLSHA